MGQTMTMEERNQQLKAFVDSANLAVAHGWKAYNAFNLGLWYGEDGRGKLSKNYFAEDGSFVLDEAEFSFNLGVQWHAAWVEMDKVLRPIIIQVLIQVALGSFGISLPGVKL